jgi:hypothetical protein
MRTDGETDRHMMKLIVGFTKFCELAQKLNVLPTQCIHVFCMDLGTNNDYFPIQH